MITDPKEAKCKKKKTLTARMDRHCDTAIEKEYQLAVKRMDQYAQQHEVIQSI